MATHFMNRNERELFIDTVFAHVPTLSALDRLLIFLEVLRHMSVDEKIAIVHAMDGEDLKFFSGYADNMLTQFTERF